LQTRLEDLADDDVGATAFGIEYATAQCEELIREGVRGLHLYSLNKAHSVAAILGNLGLDHR
jgi:methylenetetrahydrofolate reductase (NADPH)